MKYWDWYLKIAVGSALIGGSMELFMIKSGFCVVVKLEKLCLCVWDKDVADDKVTVLEAEKRALESSPEAQAMREALNPWRNHDSAEGKNS